MEKKAKILVIDDDSSMRQLLQMILKDDHFVLIADGAKTGLALFKEHDFDIVLLDIRLGDGNGIEVLKQIKKLDDTVEVIMITVVKDVRTAVEAMQCGAYDYINKDFDYDEVKILVQKALQKRSLSGEVRSLRNEIKELTQADYVLGFSATMQEVNKIVQRVAHMPSSVLITGESGTGKEVIARQIHNLSGQGDDQQYNPFVAVNISSIPSELIESTLFGHEKGSFTGAHRTHKGKFELAHNGTLFLDEIAELKQELQSKLLRAIQERQIDRVGGEGPISVNVRIIAATNQNLLEAVQNGQFREDLYYRLNVIPINLPPLRERLEDLTEFVKLILDRSCKRLNKFWLPSTVSAFRRNLYGMSCVHYNRITKFSHYYQRTHINNKIVVPEGSSSFS